MNSREMTDAQVLDYLCKKYHIDFFPGDVLLAMQEERYRGYSPLIKVAGLDIQRHEYDNGNTGEPGLAIRFFNGQGEFDNFTFEEVEQRKDYDEYFRRNKWRKVNPDELPVLQNKAKGLLDGTIANDMPEQLRIEKEGEESANNSTGLMGRSSKATLEAQLELVNDRKHGVLVLSRLMELEITRRMQELNKVRADALALVDIMMKKVERIMRTITVIELYLGVNEELHQIRSGKSAPAGTPITFRQRGMFMDEEVAVKIGFEKAKEFDYNDITVFDEWLLGPGNLDYVLPEPRSIAIFRPRRYGKDYGDPWGSAQENKKNHTYTYFLIRDGENLHRIYTDKLIVTGRLFPKRTELQDMFDKVAEARSERDKESVENSLYLYRKLATFLQGLLDRTTVFGPLTTPINLYNLTDETQQMVNFVYDDDDNLIGDGRPSFSEWHESINSSIQVGSRVLLTGVWSEGRGYVSNSDFKNRLFYYCNDYSVPRLPSRGIYTVEKPVSGHTWGYYKGSPPKELCIRYNPGGDVHGGWGSWESHERKNKISWAIQRTDGFVIHYDVIDPADVEYYLHSRAHRNKYVSMLPVLETILQLKAEEVEQEKPFVQMVLDEANRKNIATDEAEIEKAVRWWKTKNKWKRAISIDDAKALRMIIASIKSGSYLTQQPGVDSSTTVPAVPHCEAGHAE